MKDYRQLLFARFENSTLQHRTHQIAMDGSQKIPQRILAPLYERHSRGLNSPALMTALASWIKYQYGIDNLGNSYSVNDPMKNTVGKIVKDAKSDTLALIDAMTSIEPIFGNVFKEETTLIQGLSNAFNTLI